MKAEDPAIAALADAMVRYQKWQQRNMAMKDDVKYRRRRKKVAGPAEAEIAVESEEPEWTLSSAS